MALLDFLKNKKEKDKASEKKAQVASVVKKTEKKPEVKAEVKKETAKTGKDGKFSYEVVREPHISEKATILAEKNNEYVFKVYSNANKPQIKKSIEGIYNVDVLNVNVVTIPKKKRRLGRHEGFKKGYRKAIVKIKEGQKIEVF